MYLWDKPMTADEEFAMKAHRWWVERTRIANGWELQEPPRPLDWIDEIAGSCTYAPFTGWLLEVVGYRKRFNCIQYQKAAEAILRPENGESEWDWTQRFAAETVRLYKMYGRG